MTQQTCYLNAMGMLCSIGENSQAVWQALSEQTQNFTWTNQYYPAHRLPIGLYTGALPAIKETCPSWHTRNNQFALAVLDQMRDAVEAMIARYGRSRVGVVVGTSTSGIAEAEPAIRMWVQHQQVPAEYDYRMQEMGATAQFVAQTLDVQGPVYGISTACSSGAKALDSARRLIRSGICDVVIAGGVDTLCQLTVQGFSSLEAVSEEICNPFSVNRKGINIGEGAALFLVSAEPADVTLAGVGVSSDAHHISAPDPSGTGAARCMQAAIDDAGISPQDVDYINLHGTATPLNDLMESKAVHQVFGADVWCSSTKPFTGHTLGAAGAVEAGICWLALQDGSSAALPVHLWDGQPDPEISPLRLIGSDARPTSPLNYALSNSFAFGGNNVSLLMGRCHAA